MITVIKKSIRGGAKGLMMLIECNNFQLASATPSWAVKTVRTGPGEYIAFESIDDWKSYKEEEKSDDPT